MKYYLLLFLCIIPAPLFCMTEEGETQAQEVVESHPDVFSLKLLKNLLRFNFCQEKMEEVVDFVQDGLKNGKLYEKLGIWHEKQEERGHYPITYSFVVASVFLVGELKCPGVLILPAVIAALGARKFGEVWNERKLKKECYA